MELPEAQAETTSEAASIDGGKICLRGSIEQGGQWRDYKLVSLQDNICEAFFHQYQQLDIPIGSGDVEPLNQAGRCQS